MKPKLPKHKLADLELWPRSNHAIDWGCCRDLPVLARDGRHALVYHPPGSARIGRQRSYVPATLRLHDLSSVLCYRALEFPLSGGRRRLTRAMILANAWLLDAVFGENAHAVIAAALNPRTARPVVTVVFARRSRGV